MDIRPPIPPEHSYSPATMTMTMTKNHNKNNKNNTNRKRTINDDGIIETTTVTTDDAISHNSDLYDENSYLLPLVCRMYVASQTMQLGTEARFTSLVLFHRYVNHFHHLQHTTTTRDQEDQDHTDHDHKDHGTKSISSALHPMKTSEMKKGRCDSKAIKHHLGTVAAACLFLGCKAQEETRRIRDVINLSHILDFENNNNDDDDDDDDYYNGYEGMTEDKTKLSSEEKDTYKKKQQQQKQPLSKKQIIINEATHPPDLDESYWEAKERIVATEQSILRLIKFDVSVSQPHRILVIIYEEYPLFQNNDHDDEDDNNNDVEEEDVQMTPVLKSAWKRLNDALFYAPALMCGCVELACAALELALDERGNKGESYVEGKDTLHCGWKDCVGVDQYKLIDAKEKLIKASNLLSSRTAHDDNDL